MIVEGTYGPGDRLPLRVEFEQRFKASPVTVQRALDRLTAEDFVVSRGRGGTYVVDHPPHLSRYALVFPRSPGDIGWNRFWTALCNEARRLERTEPRLIRIYHGIDDHADNPGYKGLLDDVQADRLAGLVFAFTPGFLDGSPLLMSSVPRVVVLCEQTWPSMTAVTFDSKGLIDKAMDVFVNRGRRRIAILSTHWFAETYELYIASAIRSRGLTTRPYWVQAMHHSPARWVQSCSHLLMHPNQTERPDGLLITDDNLIEPVTAGLIAAGVHAPEDLDIVGHCNFPWSAPSHLSVTRVGYDIRQFLRHCIENIDRQRGGESEPTIIESPALLESEIPVELRHAATPVTPT